MLTPAHGQTFRAIFGFTPPDSDTNLLPPLSDLYDYIWMTNRSAYQSGNRDCVVSTVIPLSEDTMHSELCEELVSPEAGETGGSRNNGGSE